jgi:hypothetical protein
MTNSEAREAVDNGFRLSKPSFCPQEIWDEIIFPCWSQIADYRPSFEEISRKISGIFSEKKKNLFAKLQKQIKNLNQEFNLNIKNTIFSNSSSKYVKSEDENLNLDSQIHPQIDSGENSPENSENTNMVGNHSDPEVNLEEAEENGVKEISSENSLANSESIEPKSHYEWAKWKTRMLIKSKKEQDFI